MIWERLSFIRINYTNLRGNTREIVSIVFFFFTHIKIVTGRFRMASWIPVVVPTVKKKKKNIVHTTLQ